LPTAATVLTPVMMVATTTNGVLSYNIRPMFCMLILLMLMLRLRLILILILMMMMTMTMTMIRSTSFDSVSFGELSSRDSTTIPTLDDSTSDITHAAAADADADAE